MLWLEIFIGKYDICVKQVDKLRNQIIQTNRYFKFNEISIGESLSLLNQGINKYNEINCN